MLKIPVTIAVVIFAITCNFHSLCAQTKHTVILSGEVHASDGHIISGALVALAGADIQSFSQSDGTFVLELPRGNQTVICQALGFYDDTVRINLKASHKETKLNFILRSTDHRQLEEVRILGKSAIARVKESPFNVVALDAGSLYNSTSDLGHMLEQSSGVRIRENGGTGSTMAVTLNGFSGRHVKIFMDGVPMEGFGSAFQLNNIPAGIADRIEIYKGVVPIEFSADAMGGVINIVTRQQRNYVDLSYSYGSFNTHKTNLSIGIKKPGGFVFQLNAFQNYSDNNYKVLTNVLDLNTGNYSPRPQWVRRFHDTYHNETLMAKAGYFNKPWADRFLLGLTVGREAADIQNANLMQIVYGQRSKRGNSLLPSLAYDKKDLFIPGLELSLNANYNINRNQNTDTAARQYNWLGEYRVTRSRGEASYGLSRYRNNNGSLTAGLKYRLSESHSLLLNDVLTGYRRKNDQVLSQYDAVTATDTIGRRSTKNVLGLSYQFNYHDRWASTFFGKYYQQQVTGPVDTSLVAGQSAFAKKNRGYNTQGYGWAGTFFINEQLQFKGSFEKTYRLPTENELFGDEILETGNTTLRAEHSYNYNLGATLNRSWNGRNRLYADVSVYYRNISDYIQRLVDQRYGTAGYTNHGKVRNIGVDAELRYYYKQLFTLGGTFTYQDLRNRERYISPNSLQLSPYYNDRMRNVPYLFGNADASFFVHPSKSKNDLLSFGYTLNYVGRFFLNWESQGDRQTKADLPKQISHDLNVVYRLNDGRYNIAFEAMNFTNTMLYDNFSLQKPGRSFAVKLRYFIRTGTQKQIQNHIEKHEINN